MAKLVRALRTSAVLVFIAAVIMAALPPITHAATSKSGSTGVSGTVAAPPPTQAPTIDIPRSGQNFSNLPITVAGSCPANTTVEVYKNNVFAGAAVCQGNSYTMQIDLFDGRNDLIARAYDNLNQSSPDSNTVTVTFGSSVSTGTPRISLTTEFAKRGADPKAILNWPITLTGGTGPYAISVDWGDKSKPDLISQPSPGNINLQHTYDQSGVYKVTIQATDANGNTAFLQVVAIANGPIKQTGNDTGAAIVTTKTKVIVWPIIVLFVLILSSFWLGRKHQLEAIRNRLRKGEPPF